MPFMYLSGIAHPPPGKNAKPDDLPAHVFQSDAFRQALIGCPVTGDGGHGNTARAGRLVLASGQPLNGDSAAPMIDMLAECGNNPSHATCGRVSDAWVSRDGALRVTLEIDDNKISNLTKTAITGGILNGISISHHCSPEGNITPFETGLCLRPLRDRCYVHGLDVPATYKNTSTITMASNEAAPSAPVPTPTSEPVVDPVPADAADSDNDMSGLPEDLKGFAAKMMAPMTDDNRNSILESFTTMYRKQKDAENLIDIQKKESEARQADNNRATLGMIENAMKQLGAEFSAEDRKQYEEMGNTNPVLMRNLGGTLVTAANTYTRRDDQYKPSSRVMGIMHDAVPSFDNVPRSTPKRAAEEPPANAPAGKRPATNFLDQMRRCMK